MFFFGGSSLFLPKKQGLEGQETADEVLLVAKLFHMYRNCFRGRGRLGIAGEQTLTARSNRCTQNYRISSGSNYLP